MSIVVIFMLLPLFSRAETEGVHRVVNGEEVYEPKKEETKINTPPHKKNEVPNEKAAEKEKHNETNMKHDETKNKMDEEKTKDTQDSKAPMKEEKSLVPKKEMESKAAEKMSKYKANKVVTSDEEDPYEIHKPIGIFWFFGVFVILLIVIFVFT